MTTMEADETPVFQHRSAKTETVGVHVGNLLSLAPITQREQQEMMLRATTVFALNCEATPPRRLHRHVVDTHIRPILTDLFAIVTMPTPAITLALLRFSMFFPHMFSQRLGDLLVTCLSNIEKNIVPLHELHGCIDCVLMIGHFLQTLQILADASVMTFSIATIRRICGIVQSLNKAYFPGEVSTFVFALSTLLVRFPRDTILTLLSNMDLQPLADLIMQTPYEMVFVHELHRGMWENGAAPDKLHGRGYCLSFTDTTFSDLVIRFYDADFPVHRVLLLRMCKYFRTVFAATESLVTIDTTEMDILILKYNSSREIAKRFFRLILQAFYAGQSDRLNVIRFVTETLNATMTTTSVPDFLLFIRMAIHFDALEIAKVIELILVSKLRREKFNYAHMRLILRELFEREFDRPMAVYRVINNNTIGFLLALESRRIVLENLVAFNQFFIGQSYTRINEAPAHVQDVNIAVKKMVHSFITNTVL